jgi:hypothetical protein
MRVNFTRKRVIFTHLRVEFFRQAYVSVFAWRFLRVGIYYCVLIVMKC